MMIMARRGPAHGSDTVGFDEERPGGDGGSGTNTTMLGHLDTDIKSAPPPQPTEEELLTMTNVKLPDVTDLFKGSKKLAGFSRFTVHPHSAGMRIWDQVSVLLLLIVALLTPYEVAFMKLDLDFMFWFNRVIDLAFAFDMCLNFVLAFRDTEDGLWVRSLRRIALRYLTGWFFIDLVSVFPFDVISIVSRNPSIDTLKALRFIRLARLVKLMRVLRVGRIFKRWEAAVTIHYSVLALSKFIAWMLVLSHWLACLWELTSVIQGSGGVDLDTGIPVITWRESIQTVALPQAERYVICIYWAAMTLSTIGYGGIVPVTTAERFIVTLCMLIGACLWAYIVANVCAIVTALDQHGIELKAQIDALNYFMNDRKLPSGWRPRLRQYFMNRKRLMVVTSHNKLLQHMSPSLRGEVCLWINKHWIAKVPYFSQVSQPFATAIALALRPALFAPEELIAGTELHIISQGVCMKDGRVYASGSVWGADMILNNPRLRMTAPATTLTYVDVQRLPRYDLTNICEQFPAQAKLLRRSAMWMALRRMLIIWAFEMRVSGAIVGSDAAEAKKGASLGGDAGHTQAAKDAKLRAQSKTSKWGVLTGSPAGSQRDVVHTVNSVGRMVARSVTNAGRARVHSSEAPLVVTARSTGSSRRTTPANSRPGTPPEPRVMRELGSVATPSSVEVDPSRLPGSPMVPRLNTNRPRTDSLRLSVRSRSDSNASSRLGSMLGVLGASDGDLDAEESKGTPRHLLNAEGSGSSRLRTESRPRTDSHSDVAALAVAVAAGEHSSVAGSESGPPPVAPTSTYTGGTNLVGYGHDEEEDGEARQAGISTTEQARIQVVLEELILSSFTEAETRMNLMFETLAQRLHGIVSQPPSAASTP